MTKSKNLLLIILMLAILTILSPYPNKVFAKTENIQLTVFATGSTTIKADGATIHGYIEYASTIEELATSECAKIVDNIRNILKNYSNTKLDINYISTYPANQNYYEKDAYLGYINFLISLEDISLIKELTNEITNIEYVTIDGIHFTANTETSSSDALKQAIAKANIKAQNLYSTPLNILEIEEKEYYNDNGVYVSFCNLNFDNIPQIEITAKVEITFEIANK